MIYLVRTPVGLDELEADHHVIDAGGALTLTNWLAEYAPEVLVGVYAPGGWLWCQPKPTEEKPGGGA